MECISPAWVGAPKRFWGKEVLSNGILSAKEVVLSYDTASDKSYT